MAKNLYLTDPALYDFSNVGASLISLNFADFSDVRTIIMDTVIHKNGKNLLVYGQFFWLKLSLKSTLATRNWFGHLPFLLGVFEGFFYSLVYFNGRSIF